MVSRTSLPEEFYDITSARLLTEPEPQYLHAQLAKMAIAADLQVGQMGLPGRGPSSQGAEYASINDGRFAISDPIYGEAVMAITELGKAPGHTIRMNRPRFTDSTYTEAAREITGQTSISTTPLDVGSSQVACTIKRFAGPYGASAVQPYAIDEFDSKLSIHKLAAIVGLHMKRDYDKWLDAIMCALYAVCDTTVYPTGMTADADATTQDAFPLDLETLFRVEESLDNAKIPVFGNGRRVCILHPRQIRELKSDSQFTQLVKFHKEVNPIFSSYAGTLGRLDMFVSSTLTTATVNTDKIVYRGQAFGPGKVGLGVGALPRVLSSTDDNYGLQSKVIWCADLGAVNLDSRFGVLVSST